jgi:outer membrane lipopolysaccharide assembly protein LptE/RlpB
MARILALGLMACQLVGCGYSFSGGGSVLPPDVKKVEIPLVENSSTETGLATVVTEAFRDQFERYGVITIVEERQDADAILNARILRVRRATSTVSARDDGARQQDTSMVLAAELVRPDGQVLWRNPRIVVTKAFATSSDTVVTSSVDFAGGSLGATDLRGLGGREVSRGQEQEALNNLAEQAARTVYDQAVMPDF